eukprot:Opistho-1_new@4712
MNTKDLFILDLPISDATPDDVLQSMASSIAKKEVGRYISITNTESMYHGLRNSAHGDYIKGADFSLCDGVGVIVAGWAWGHDISRFNGPILQLEASKLGLEHGWRHFFLRRQGR